MTDCDLLIVGGGPCGLAAAISAQRAGLKPLVLEAHVICSTINRNVRSFALAIVGAEYLMRLLPMGTHRYGRLIRPSELTRWARAAGLELSDLAGLAYEPFSRKARVTADVSVNYLADYRRPSGVAAA